MIVTDQPCPVTCIQLLSHHLTKVSLKHGKMVNTQTYQRMLIIFTQKLLLKLTRACVFLLTHFPFYYPPLFKGRLGLWRRDKV